MALASSVERPVLSREPSRSCRQPSGARPKAHTPLRPVDRAALDQAWPVLRPRLLRRAGRLLHTWAAEDLVQTTYLKAVTGLAGCNSRSASAGMYGWLCSILTNVHLKEKLRKEQRNEAFMAPPDLALTVDADTDTTALDDADESPSVEEVEAHLQILGLTRRRREIWQLWSRGHNQTEIAAALGITQQNISYHVGVIIDQLRASGGDLITRADGYASATAMFNEHARVTVYRPPKRGAGFRVNGRTGGQG